MAQKTTKYRVINGKLNLRAEPSLEAEVKKVLENGAEIGVYEIADGWAKVRGGYVMAEFLEAV